MSVVRRTRDGIDILEHAMKGVRTSGNQGEIRGFYSEPGNIGMRSTLTGRAVDDTPEEPEVIVTVRPAPRRR